MTARLAPDLEVSVYWSNRILDPIQRRSKPKSAAYYTSDFYSPIKEPEEHPDVIEANRSLNQAAKDALELFTRLYLCNQQLPSIGEEVNVAGMTFNVDNRIFFMPTDEPRVPMIVYSLGSDDYAHWESELGEGSTNA